ncbi:MULTISPECIES: hypothetical protein [Bacillaceae]|jgi:hypothetical protein|uniref:hypothetical protein n=1 Tax=Robertmurraya sp. TaxID=2837525 RepID=UPI0013C4E017|nr:hypothetical protein [Bacillus sp. Y1]
MSFGVYQFFNWLIFIWCGLGMLFIAIASIREVFFQLKKTGKAKDQDSGTDIKLS